jgi:medium-chain acyl-[acyl-carrier-protein] hydrolase
MGSEKGGVEPMERTICMSGFCRFRPVADARIRLFCLPYAGGTAQTFKKLVGSTGPAIEVVGVDYPGHGTRFGETLLTDLHRLVDDLSIRIRPLLDIPFALYGHSNGALVAFELAHRLSTLYFRETEALFVAAKRSPTLPGEAPAHRLSEDAFIDHLRGYDGTPEQVLNHPELMSVYLPILRADFALGETYRLGERTRLEVPVHGLAGIADRLASPQDMLGWESLTTADFRLHLVKGHHFFVETHAEDVGELITRVLM